MASAAPRTPAQTPANLSSTTPTISTTEAGSLLLPLPFHRAIVTELLADDSALIVLARGLGSSNLVRFFVHSFAYPTCLVFILDAGRFASPDYSLFENLPTGTNRSFLHVFTADTASSQRHPAYLKGGVFLVTARILVVDFLQNKVPLHLVTGVIVRSAERVSSTSTEAFCLRLLKKENQMAFIRAFSEVPEALVGGFSKLEKVMAALQLRKLFVWPRFHVTVSDSLSQCPVDTVEVHVSMTPNMYLAQVALFELIAACIAEFRPLAPHMTFESLDGGLGNPTTTEEDEVPTINGKSRRKKRSATASKTLAEAFINHGAHAIGIGSRPSGQKARTLWTDLHLLRRLLSDLTELDAVSFLSYLETIYRAYAPGSFFNQRESNWILTNSAAQLMSVSRDRVLSSAFDASTPCHSDPILLKIEKELGVRATLEIPPKWRVLLNIIGEVMRDPVYRDESPRPLQITSCSKVRILILCRENKTAHHVATFLGSRDSALIKNFKDYLLWSGKLKNATKSSDVLVRPFISPAEAQPRSASAPVTVGSVAAKRRRVRDIPASSVIQPPITELPSSISKESIEKILLDATDGQETSIHGDPEELDDVFSQPIPMGTEFEKCEVLIRVPSGTDEDEQLLPKVNPDVIVLFDAMSTMVRRIEVYQAAFRPEIHLRTYFMTYKESIEEQQYLASIRREREAFERVIKSYASAVVPLMGTGTSSTTHDDAEISLVPELRSVRAAAGHQQTYGPRTVIVDIREFRASLPGELHALNLQIVPCTLNVGDYVLAPEVVIERKSFADLTQSLGNGRLYSQVKAMCLHYKVVLILIEIFDRESLSLFQTGGNSFESQSVSMQAMLQSAQESVASKVVLLNIHFPQVRLLWSSSASMSAELIENIKRGRKEPVEDQAVAVGTGSTLSACDNYVVHSMLCLLPGIEMDAQQSVIHEFPTLLKLITAASDCDSMRKVLGGAERARQLNRFVGASGLRGRNV